MRMDQRARAGDDTVGHGAPWTESILDALGDESSRSILVIAIGRGRTVEEMRAETKIPLSTCYKKVALLVRMRLMVPERYLITHSGRKYAVYRTCLQAVTVRFNSGDVEVEVEPNAEFVEKLLSEAKREGPTRDGDVFPWLSPGRKPDQTAGGKRRRD